MPHSDFFLVALFRGVPAPSGGADSHLQAVLQLQSPPVHGGPHFLTRLLPGTPKSTRSQMPLVSQRPSPLRVSPTNVLIVPPFECAWLNDPSLQLANGAGCVSFEVRGMMIRKRDTACPVACSLNLRSPLTPDSLSDHLRPLATNDVTLLFKAKPGSRRWQHHERPDEDEVGGRPPPPPPGPPTSTSPPPASSSAAPPEADYTVILGSHRNSCLKVERNGMPMARVSRNIFILWREEVPFYFPLPSLKKKNNTHPFLSISLTASLAPASCRTGSCASGLISMAGLSPWARVRPAAGPARGGSTRPHRQQQQVEKRPPRDPPPLPAPRTPPPGPGPSATSACPPGMRLLRTGLSRSDRR